VELSRAVRFALWDYKAEAALTAVCDADVQKYCPKGGKARNKGVFTIGVVGGWRCWGCCTAGAVAGASASSDLMT
jgi:hypothetical protein